jgi:peptide/nickel transport system substrate-binding protein
MRRFTSAGVLAAVAAMVLASSGGGASAREGGTFRIGALAFQFPSIDPAFEESPPQTVVLSAVCAGLMTTPDKAPPAGLRVVPEIAVDYPKVSNRGRTYTFKIRRDFRFSTGARVTARDVAHTINRILSPVMKSRWAQDFAAIVGAQAVIDGRAKTASGVVAGRNTLTIRLVEPLAAFTVRMTTCVLPSTMPLDPEGAKAPMPTAGPYYVAQYAPGVRVVLERNRFYRGERPRHVDRFVVDLQADAPTMLDRVDRGRLDYSWVPAQDYAPRSEEFKRKYGVNKARFFVVPGTFLRIFVLNTSRPLFRNNVELRQAVNFAIDRKALLRERGPLAGYLTDQYLPPTFPGFRNERIYPLKAPELAKARALARGNRRSGKAVLYVPAIPLGAAQGQIVKDNLRKIGLDVEIQQFPGPVLFNKLATPGEPFDMGWIGWDQTIPDPSLLNFLFDGRTIGKPGFGNWSYFDSRKYNRLLDAASRLPPGPERYRVYGKLDVDIARNAAPAVAYAYDNVLTLVSRRTGCVILKPYLDLAAVCLK